MRWLSSRVARSGQLPQGGSVEFSFSEPGPAQVGFVQIGAIQGRFSFNDGLVEVGSVKIGPVEVGVAWPG